MNNQCCQKSDCDCQSSNSGFIFGLVIGAVIGAIIAIIIYKNNKTEVFERLSSQIKNFFQNLTGQEPKPESQKSSPQKPTKIIAIKKEISPVSVKPKKAVPKMFVKLKK